MRKQRKRNDESGQSTVEFALTLILMLAFFLFYFQLSMVFAFGNYVHYATFMAARAYLSAGQTQDDQESRAKDVIVQMLKKSAGEQSTDRFPFIAKGEDGEDVRGLYVKPPSQFVDDDRFLSWMQGVRYRFRSKVFMIPLAGFAQPKLAASVNSVQLTSESWLGREPSADECQQDLGSMKGYFDNGC